MKNKIVKIKYILNTGVILSGILLTFVIFSFIFFIIEKQNNIVNIKSTEKVFTDNTFFDEDKDYLIYYEHVVFEDITTNKILKYDEFLDKTKLSEFTTKINDLSYLKYPEFVVEELIKNSTVKNYDLYEEYLLITFSNYLYEPELGKITLKIYYNEIKEYLIKDVKVIENYKNETGDMYDPTKKTIAFTFDDGPHAVYTEQIMDSLNRNHAGATFFMLGLQIELLPDVAKKVNNAGFEIGLHSYSHKNFTRQSIEDTIDELTHNNRLLYSATGSYSSLVRPPYGSFNDNIINNIDYSYILWNVDTDDWRYKDVDGLVNHVLENVNDGDIILFHDIFKTSAEAVEKVLPQLYLKGYQVVDISTLAKLKDQSLDLNKYYSSFN